WARLRATRAGGASVAPAGGHGRARAIGSRSRRSVGDSRGGAPARALGAGPPFAENVPGFSLTQSLRGRVPRALVSIPGSVLASRIVSVSNQRALAADTGPCRSSSVCDSAGRSPLGPLGFRP